MNFAAAADELHCQERARLAAAVTPTPEQLRSMTTSELRDEIAAMWERLGHNVITGAGAELVHVKGERKFISLCANSNDLTPTGSAALRRLRDRVVASSAERGFFFSMRGFTAEALHYAEAAPVQSVDCAQLLRALQSSRKGMQLPQTYKAMCRQCGDIVQHRLDSAEAKRCGNGHSVVPTIALPEVVKPERPRTGQPAPGQPAPTAIPAIVKVRNMSAKARRRRAMKAHNYRRWKAPTLRLPYGGEQ